MISVAGFQGFHREQISVDCRCIKIFVIHLPIGECYSDLQVDAIRLENIQL